MSHPLGTIVAYDKNVGYICRGYACLGYPCTKGKTKRENCPTSDNCFYEVLSSRRQAVNCGILACCLPSIFRSRQLQPLSPCPP